ncbi:MAG: carbohydrate kinase family protein [Candidatus Sumerlaeaceae bacterium]
MAERHGVAGAGNWIIDQVKVIDRFPEEERLAIILEETRGTGGAPYNVLVGLRCLDGSLPLEAIGVVGNDANGEYILEHQRRLNIAQALMRTSDKLPTSYTDVMSVQSTGRRTFFHNRGANALLCGEDFEFDRVRAKILHLGYLMLLDAMDEPDEADPTRPCAARVLEEAQSLGILTSLDMVSDLSPRLHHVVAPTLRHVDYFIANELEAGALAEVAIRDESNHLLRNNLPQIAEVLFSKGVARLVCIHAPEGGFWMEKGGRPLFKPSLNVPQLINKGTAGAGDAFCGGILYGLHEGWDEDRCLTLAVAHAAQSLSHPTTTGGLKSLSETVALVDRFGYRE